MSQIKEQLIRLGQTNPELRGHLRPVLDCLNKTARRGKIRDEHAKELEDAIKSYVQRYRDDVIAHRKALESEPNVGDIDKRFRWDLFWALGDSFTREWSNKVREYGVKDSHKDTLFRQIVRELNLPF